MYLQVAVVGCVQRHQPLAEIARGHYKRLGKSVMKPSDIDFVARIMYTKHIMTNNHWKEVYEKEFLNKHLVKEDTPELQEFDLFIAKCGGWLKFLKVLKHYAERRLFRITSRYPRNEPLKDSGKKLVEKINAIPKDGRCH